MGMSLWPRFLAHPRCRSRSSIGDHSIPCMVTHQYTVVGPTASHADWHMHRAGLRGVTGGTYVWTTVIFLCFPPVPLLGLHAVCQKLRRRPTGAGDDRSEIVALNDPRGHEFREEDSRVT